MIRMGIIDVGIFTRRYVEVIGCMDRLGGGGEIDKIGQIWIRSKIEKWRNIFGSASLIGANFLCFVRRGRRVERELLLFNKQDISQGQFLPPGYFPLGIKPSLLINRRIRSKAFCKVTGVSLASRRLHASTRVPIV